MWLFVIFVTFKTTLWQLIYECLLIKGVCGILVVLLWVFGWDFCLHLLFFYCCVFGGFLFGAFSGVFLFVFVFYFFNQSCFCSGEGSGIFFPLDCLQLPGCGHHFPRISSLKSKTLFRLSEEWLWCRVSSSFFHRFWQVCEVQSESHSNRVCKV